NIGDKLHRSAQNENESGDCSSYQKECGSRHSPAHSSATLAESAKFLWDFRISNTIAVEINDAEPNTMLHFALAKVVKPGRPLAMFLQVIRDMFGEQDVAGIAAVHHSLGHINPATGDVRASADISYFTDRAAMNSHPHGDVGMGLECLRDL